jgi:L-rhamnose mutarotase
MAAELTPERAEKFLKALAEMPNVARAARLTGVSRYTVYEHRKNDLVFAAQWLEAIETAVQALEEKAWKRAQLTSDTLMIFMLKAHKPEVYRETTRHEISGQVDQKTTVTVDEPTLDRLAEIARIMASIEPGAAPADSPAPDASDK